MDMEQLIVTVGIIFGLGQMLFGLLLLTLVSQFTRKLLEVGDNSDSGSSSKNKKE